jgi:hypothetical protein
MTIKNYEVVKASFENYFKLSVGSIWTDPNLYSPLEDLQFEALEDWGVQKTVESKLVIDFKKHFKGLDIPANGIKFKRVLETRTLDIKIVASIKGYKDFKEFNISVKVGK